MSASERAITQLESYLGKHQSAFQSEYAFDIRGLVEARESGPRLMYCVATALPKFLVHSPHSRGVQTFEYPVRRLSAFAASVSVEEFIRALRGIEATKRLVISGLDLEFQGDSNQGPSWQSELYARSSQYEYDWRGLFTGPMGFHELKVSTGDRTMWTSEDLRELQYFGFKSLGELVTTSLTPMELADGAGFDSNRSRDFERGILVLFPSWPGRIRLVQFSDKTATVGLELPAGKGKLRNLRLVCRLTLRIDPHTVVTIPTIVDPVRKMITKVYAKQRIESVEATLFLRRENGSNGPWLDQHSGGAVIPESLAARNHVYRLADKDMRWLHKAIREGNTDAKLFEWGVPTLFHLGGFNVVWTGYPGGGGSEMDVDFLAYTPGWNSLILGEVTLGSSQLLTKLEKLNKKRNAVAKSQPKIVILSLLCTDGHDGDIVKAVKEAAIDQGMCILTREKLVELETLVNRGAAPDEIFKWLAPARRPI
jgi:hypothetical protein